MLWVDNMGQSEGLLDEFRAWFADTGTKKVWHNYGFDRHVLFNHGGGLPGRYQGCMLECVLGVCG